MNNNINLLDLNDDILSIIGDYVKKDNLTRIRKERDEKNTTCVCGCVLSKSSPSIHKKTNKHLKLMEQYETYQL
jgi:hypothetical protein